MPTFGLLQLKRNKIDCCIAARVTRFHDFMILMQKEEEEEEEEGTGPKICRLYDDYKWTDIGHRVSGARRNLKINSLLFRIVFQLSFPPL